MWSAHKHTSTNVIYLLQMNWDYLLECPLQEVAALLNPLGTPSPYGGSPAHTPVPRTASSSGLGDSRQDVRCNINNL